MTSTDRSGLLVDLTEVRWRRWLEIVGVVVLHLVVLAFVITAVPQVVGADHSYVVLSGSMQPTMDPGDVIFVRDVEPGAIEEGDILTFGGAGESTPTTHRVVEIVERDGQQAFRMKGDANEDPDQELVQPSEVEGRLMTVGGMLFIVPAIGYAIHFANSPLGFTVLVMLPIAAIATSELWSLISTVRSQESPAGHPPEQVEASSAGQPVNQAVIEDEEDVLVTFRPGELRLGLVILFAFTAYSVLVAYIETAGWSVGIAVAVGLGTVLFWTLYRSGEDGDTQSELSGVDRRVQDDHLDNHHRTRVGGSEPND